MAGAESDLATPRSLRMTVAADPAFGVTPPPADPRHYPTKSFSPRVELLLVQVGCRIPVAEAVYYKKARRAVGNLP